MKRFTPLKRVLSGGCLCLLALGLSYAAAWGAPVDGPTSAPGVAIEAAGAVQCRGNLSQLRLALQIRVIKSEPPPASLQELGLPPTILRCPVTGDPYEYDPKTGRVHCIVHDGKDTVVSPQGESFVKGDSIQAATLEIPGKIAWIRVRERSVTGDVWVAKANGDNPRGLTTTGDCSRPSWSPDGSKIAYLRDAGNIWIVTADGGKPQQLTTTGDCLGFSWSPDGTKIAYNRDVGGSAFCGYLWCYDLAARRAVRVIPELITGTPQWSPDGEWLAFWRLVRRKVKGEDEGDEGDISSAFESRLAICSPSGQNQKTLIAPKELAPYFTWSPGSKRIYFGYEEFVSGRGVWTIAFVELSNPGRSQASYRYKEEISRLGSPEFINEKEIAAYEEHFGEGGNPGIPQVLIIDVEAGKFRKEVVSEPSPRDYWCNRVCFLGDTRAFWWEGAKMGPPDSTGTRFQTRPPLLALVVNGKVVKTMEGAEVTWVRERPSLGTQGGAPARPPEALLAEAVVDDANDERWLRVTKGQFTFDLEGNDIQGNPWFSRTIHWPGRDDSGVTIGRGYDIGQRSRDEAIRDLTAAGIAVQQAEKLAEAAGLKGGAAGAFVNANKIQPWATITRKQQWQFFENMYPASVKAAREGVNNARRWGIRFADGTVKMYPPDGQKPRSFEDLPAAVRDIAADFAYNVGEGEFRQNNWGGILQMDSYQAMPDYIEGRITGEILDAEGSPSSTGWRAETVLERWRKQAGTQRVNAILNALRSQATNAHQGAEGDISGRYRGKLDFEWIVYGGERIPAADKMDEEEITGIDVDITLNQTQKSVRGTITLSRSDEELTLPIERGLIEGKSVTFITELLRAAGDPSSHRIRFEGEVSGKSMMGKLAALTYSVPGLGSGSLEGRLYAQLAGSDEMPPSYPGYLPSVAEWEGWREAAIAWGQANAGAKEYHGECLRFVAEAFMEASKKAGRQGVGPAGWSSAQAAAEALARAGALYPPTGDAPPRGALIFFSGGGAYREGGHVGICLGERAVLNGGWETPVMTIEAMLKLDEIDSYLGWAYPPQAWYGTSAHSEPGAKS